MISSDRGPVRPYPGTDDPPVEARDHATGVRADGDPAATPVRQPRRRRPRPGLQPRPRPHDRRAQLHYSPPPGCQHPPSRIIPIPHRPTGGPPPTATFPATQTDPPSTTPVPSLPDATPTAPGASAPPRSRPGPLDRGPADRLRYRPGDGHAQRTGPRQRRTRRETAQPDRDRSHTMVNTHPRTELRLSPPASVCTS